MATPPALDDYAPSELAVATAWIDQTCSTPGCNVVIRSRVGHQATTLPVCKWCQGGLAYYRHIRSTPMPTAGPHLTLDEFGRDLYEAIVLRAVSVMAANGAERMRTKGYTDAAQQAERSAQVAESALHRLLDKGTIGPADVKRILRIQ